MKNKKVFIPKNVIRISSNDTSNDINVFGGCTSLEEIAVDSQNRIYASQGGMLLSKEKDTLLVCPNGKTSCTIPQSVKRINYGAFNGCSKLAELVIPANVIYCGIGSASNYNSYLDLSEYNSLKKIILYGDVEEWGNLYNLASTNALAQNSLLKMLDGDTIEFGAEDKQPKLTVDCSKVSVVMLGAFEKLLTDKSGNARRIGFGAEPKAEAGRHRDISHEDLINAGMRREIAGRVNRIVALDPLTANDYKAILTGPVLSGMRTSLGCQIRITGTAADALAEQAASSGLGVRWMKSEIRNAVDDAMFDIPESKDWQIGLRDGKLHCRAQKPGWNCGSLEDAVAFGRRFL